MKSGIRRRTLTLLGAAVIALAYVGWSGSQRVHTAGTPAGVVTPAPAAALQTPDPRVARLTACDRADCLAGLSAAADDCAACLRVGDGRLFELEPVSAGQPWTSIVDGGFAAAPPASIEPSATASPAPEISTAAMVAFGVVLLTARRAGRNRWASWKAPWRTRTLPASG
ncbi:MAG: hypothetical protein WAK41_13000 [Roseiarcus sp.]|jgi:hypothetical protein|uniref:hypothetical protein n=1 Tax=Roseiarcus sp. TaxID=1969460 RepID=UPI003BB1BA33